MIQDFTQHIGKYGEAWSGLAMFRDKREMRAVFECCLYPGPSPEYGLAVTYSTNQEWVKYETGEVLRFGTYSSEADYWIYHGQKYPWICLVGFFDQRFLPMCASPAPDLPRIFKFVDHPHLP